MLRDIDDRWQTELKTAAAENRQVPTQFADADSESLRFKLLYGPTAPCEVPDEAMVNIETFFDLASCEELWRIQAEVDNWLIGQPLAPAHAAILEDRPITVNPRVLQTRPSRQQRGRGSASVFGAPLRRQAAAVSAR